MAYNNKSFLVPHQCGRAFDPNFLFLWPNAKVSVTAPGHIGSLLPLDGDQDEEPKKQEEKLNSRLAEESSAFFSSGRMWDDGVILPQNTRKVNGHFLKKKKSGYLLVCEYSRRLLTLFGFRFLEMPWTSSNSSDISCLQRSGRQHLCVCRGSQLTASFGPSRIHFFT